LGDDNPGTDKGGNAPGDGGMADSKKKVLVVDDARFTRELLKRIITDGDFTIVGEATNGKEAVDLYTRLRPDIVTMDIVMPLMDGLRALEEIKKLDANSKVFMVTALDQDILREEALGKGATGFIGKPFKASQVLRSLNFVQDQQD
jgi:two-component system, chemotaxis family, chemotaxis protein CheY